MEIGKRTPLPSYIISVTLVETLVEAPRVPVTPVVASVEAPRVPVAAAPVIVVESVAVVSGNR